MAGTDESEVLLTFGYDTSMAIPGDNECFHDSLIYAHFLLTKEGTDGVFSPFLHFVHKGFPSITIHHITRSHPPAHLVSSHLYLSLAGFVVTDKPPPR